MSQTIRYWHDACVGHCFNVWAGNIGVCRAGRASLDYRLRDNSHIRDHVISLLEFLSETLENSRTYSGAFPVVISDFSLAISIVNGTRLPFDCEEPTASSDSDSSDEAELLNLMPPKTELQQLEQSMVKMVKSLLKMSAVIRDRSVSQDRLRKSSKIDVSFYEPLDIQYVKDKFPHADDDLVTRLGRAISNRRQYLEYRKQEHEKLANPLEQTIPTPNKKEIGQPQEQDSGILPGIQTDRSPPGPASSADQSASYAVPTTASTSISPEDQQPITLDVDVFSESGTTSSTQSSSVGDEEPELPPLPKASEGGQEFECPYCYTICKTTGTTDSARRRQWKRHVFQDLLPYICTFANCMRTTTMYEKRTDWFRHESYVHRKEWSCNVSDHGAFQDSDRFAKHMEEAHGEARAQLPNILTWCERSLTTTLSTCPLCQSEDAKDLSPEQLEKHLGRHMEILALFALPRDDDKRGDTSVPSDLAAEASTSTTLS